MESIKIYRVTTPFQHCGSRFFLHETILVSKDTILVIGELCADSFTLDIELLTKIVDNCIVVKVVG